MNIKNIHSRKYPVAQVVIGALLDSLATPNDNLWPHESWPRMKFNKPLSIGAVGGHSSIRYSIKKYVPGEFIEFSFTAPKGFDGTHFFEVAAINSNDTELKHTILMRTHGSASFSWLLAIRPLHDALLEDALTKVESKLGLQAHPEKWSILVKALRQSLSVGKSRSETVA